MSEEFVADILSTKTEKESVVDEPLDKETPIEKPATEKESTDAVTPPEDKLKEDSVKTPTIEELAIQIGWNPNHKGDDSVDAATYILKSREIQNTMKLNNKDLKNQLLNMQSSIEALKEHNERVYKAELKQKEAEIANLKKEKLAAVELADVKKVTEIDEQIENIKKDLTQAQIKKDTPVSNPDFDEWIKDNQWYLTDDEMAKFAETVAEQYQGAPRARVYKIIRQKVAEVFPEKFETPANPKKEKPIGPASPVEAPTKTTVASKFTKADLSPEQLSIMKQFVSQGIMTEEQYINDIAKLQGA
jgi:hypothetical protein